MFLQQQTQSRLVDYFKMQSKEPYKDTCCWFGSHVVRLAVIGNFKRVSSFVCKPEANKGIGKRVLQR